MCAIEKLESQHQMSMKKTLLLFDFKTSRKVYNCDLFYFDFGVTKNVCFAKLGDRNIGG